MKGYVTFTAGGIKVDIARYLKTPEGQAALDRLEKASKRFDPVRTVPPDQVAAYNGIK